MPFRVLKPMLAMLLCASAACAYAQLPSLALPNAPHEVAAELGAVIPEPPSVTRESTFLPLPPLTTTMVALAEPKPPAKAKLLDGKSIALGVAVFGLTSMDLEFTQHCLHEGTCRELNPVLPHSRLGMYAVNTPVNLAVMYFSLRRRAAGKRSWWVSPIVDIGSHMVGVGSNMRFLGK
jgi:hypothetical protein